MSYCLNPHCSKPENPEDVKFCITCGTKLLLKERYRAIKPIGQGGFGRTFLAVDEDKPSKPSCVIKQLYPQAQGTNTVQKAIELFNQEAIQLDELGTHTQIPQLLAYCTQDDRQYLVQEFIDGQNLSMELSYQGNFHENQIIELIYDVLNVLQFCHSKQVIHRDIKPENIIRRRSDDKLVIVDFGAAKSTIGQPINMTGTSIGSPEYVAPEQMRGKATFASDIYSLGVTCINLLTGRSPFDSYDTHNATWRWRQFVKTPISNELGIIIDKMVQVIPRKRYQNVGDIFRDLQSLNPPTSTNIPTTIVNPPARKQSFASQNHNQLEQELHEVKTHFTGSKQQPHNPTPQTSNPLPVNKKLDVIDRELEEMKAKFLGEE
ncbi:MAG: protein kinase [Sphaerospermopsis sp. SIO1G2]|nr:protein kinase [Sphaerospermopsis sp. SIO1G1]NET71014.1 protein kinase [Sphaerospermopsis sp. SIO1G2]